jgi:hypothetical protein
VTKSNPIKINEDTRNEKLRNQSVRKSLPLKPPVSKPQLANKFVSRPRKSESPKHTAKEVALSKQTLPENIGSEP